MDYKKKIEIPFGAFDSELIRQEISIPNGFKAVIDGNKIILTRAESADEKIRKEIVDFIDINTIGSDERRNRWFSYLENQCETYTKRDVDNAYIEGMAFAKTEIDKQSDSPIKWNKNTKDCKPKVSHSVLMKTTHGIAEGEWQGEYWHQYRWAGIVRDTDVLSWIELSELEKQGEQKPIEWDADDDDKFFFLKARLKDYEDCIIYDEELSMCQKNNVRETTKEFLEWLDSIKERIGG